MGAKQTKIQYSVPISEPKKGETAIYRRAGFEGELCDSLANGCKTLQELLVYNNVNFPDRQFLGRRLLQEDGSLGNTYVYETYNQVYKVAQQLGSGMTHLGLTEEKAQYQDYKIKFISIYAANSREWFLVDMANMLYGFSTMPIYDTLGEEATDYMFNQTELSTVFLTCNHLKGVAERITTNSTPHLKNLVIMDSHNLTDEIKATLDGITYYTIEQVLEAGKDKIVPLPTIKDTDVAFFSYTSGTTGAPKGAMINHRNLFACTSGAEKILPLKQFDTHLSYLPLAHVLERIVTVIIMDLQGSIAFFGGNVRKLKDDLALVKPDFFVSVPRLYNKFFDAIKKKLNAASGIPGYLASKAVASKEYYLENGGYYKHKLWDTLVFNKVKKILGGKCTYMLTGSAPISSEVRKFLKIAFSCPFAEGYGQTEAIGGEFLTHPEDPEVGHVGGPIPHLEFKLLDVPEMNYLSTDMDSQGKLAPRGEILVRSKAVIAGYYKNKAKTDAAIDSDGWLHSGDIGTILPHNGALKIIDRRKNIFKLSIGEYIAPDKLEEVYKTVDGVDNIYVYGDSLKSCLIAIVYSEPANLTRIAGELGIEGTYEDLIHKPEIIKHFVDTLLAKTKSAKLKGFEKIKKLALAPKSFEEEGLLTATFKLKKHSAKTFYKEVLDNLYVGLN